MGFRYRKSIKITKGIKININKNSTSVTFGRGPVKRTINSNGKVTRSVHVPHTGVYYTETVKTGNKSQNNKQPKKYSPITYKVASVSAFICAFIFIFLGLILLFVAPPLGFLILIFGVSCFLCSNNFRKQAKQAKQEQQDYQTK